MDIAKYRNIILVVLSVILIGIITWVYTGNFQTSPIVNELITPTNPTCPEPNAPMLIQGYRVLYDGATIKAELVSPADSRKFFIAGAGAFVAERLNANDLKWAVRDTSGKIERQIFVKETKKMTSSPDTDCEVFNAKGTDYYLQYEHGTFSLRRLHVNGTAFDGQCFVNMGNVSEAEINSMAMTQCIKEVNSSGSTLDDTNVNNYPDPENTLHNQLTAETDAKYMEALKGVTDKINLLASKLDPENPKGSVFGTGGPIKINLNVAGLTTKTTQPIIEPFESTNVRGILDGLENKAKMNTELEGLLRNKFGCRKGIDRTQFYTDSQLAQCKGCVPDDFLKGQLGPITGL